MLDSSLLLGIQETIYNLVHFAPLPYGIYMFFPNEDKYQDKSAGLLWFVIKSGAASGTASNKNVIKNKNKKGTVSHTFLALL